MGSSLRVPACVCSDETWFPQGPCVSPAALPLPMALCPGLAGPVLLLLVPSAPGSLSSLETCPFESNASCLYCLLQTSAPPSPSSLLLPAFLVMAVSTEVVLRTPWPVHSFVPHLPLPRPPTCGHSRLGDSSAFHHLDLSARAHTRPSSCPCRSWVPAPWLQPLSAHHQLQGPSASSLPHPSCSWCSPGKAVLPAEPAHPFCTCSELFLAWGSCVQHRLAVTWCLLGPLGSLGVSQLWPMGQIAHLLFCGLPA